MNTELTIKQLINNFNDIIKQCKQTTTKPNELKHIAYNILESIYQTIHKFDKEKIQIRYKAQCSILNQKATMYYNIVAFFIYQLFFSTFWVFADFMGTPFVSSYCLIYLLPNHLLYDYYSFHYCRILCPQHNT